MNTETKQQGSAIEWTDYIWEVTAGCTKVSDGCKHCYAETLVGTRLAGMARKRRDNGAANGSALDITLDVITNPRDPEKRSRWNNTVRTLPMNLDQPLKRRKPTRYFVNSRSDLFHEHVPFACIDRVFAVMALCPRHRFMVLTKRPERMRAYLEDTSHARRDGRGTTLLEMGGETLEGHDWPLPHVWLGTSVEDQATANARLPELLACPAAGRFVSAEPLLGAVELPLKITDLQRMGWTYTSATEIKSKLWVIVGGESGAGARPCNIEWIRSIKDQCQHAGVPVFVKQLGKWINGDHDQVQRWLCRGDDGKEHVWIPPILRSQLHPERFENPPPGAVAWGLGDAKGGDPSEWPTDLRVRETPEGLRVESTIGGGR